MNITFLGTGTSTGIPLIGCNCKTCISTNPKDRRLRSSVWVKENETSIIIDVGPDFRQQAISNSIEKLDAVLITHEHNDHIIGLDDIRPYNFMSKKDIPIYGLPRVLKDIKAKFHYAFNSEIPGTPRMVDKPLSNEQFQIKNTKIIPIQIIHGPLPILGFRIGPFAYITDASDIEENEMSKLENLDVLVINALRLFEHKNHFTLDEALEKIKRLKPKKAFLTHVSHHMPPISEVQHLLPPNVSFAFDNLTIEV